MTGATASAASTFAGSDTSDTRSKCRATSGAVPSVAAIVTASASARPRGHPTAAQARAQRGDEREHRDDGGEAQLPAGIFGGTRVPRQRDRRGEQERVPARGRPAGEHGDEARHAHDGGALDRRAAAGERDVGRDEGDRQPQAGGEAEPGGGPDRQDEGREQEDVRPARRDEVREAGCAEVLAHRLGERAVLAEHHPAGERALRGLKAARERALRAGADAVERAEEATAPPARRRGSSGAQQRVGVAPALVRVERPERGETASHGELDPGLRSGRPGHVRRRAQQHPLAASGSGLQADRRDPDAERALARMLEQRRPDAELAARQRPQRRSVERCEPRLRDDGAAEDRDDGAQREQRLATDRDRREHRGGHGRRRAGSGEQARDDRRQHDVTRMASREVAPGSQPRSPGVTAAPPPTRHRNPARSQQPARTPHTAPPPTRHRNPTRSQQPAPTLGAAPRSRPHRGAAGFEARAGAPAGRRSPAHTVTSGVSVARRLAPMPGTSASSSTRRKPPCCSR